MTTVKHFKHEDDLTFKTKDSQGKIAPVELIGKRLQHTGNKKIYRVVAPCWDGEIDEWKFIAREDVNGSVFIVRPVSHIKGRRSNGQRRYTEVEK